MGVMDYVKEDGLYLKYDWTIKVDADCVFLPDRLRSHLWALRPPANVPIYVKNNNLQGLGNAGFLGAIEVFSREAMKKFMDNKEIVENSLVSIRVKMASSSRAWMGSVWASSGTRTCSSRIM